jgi:hypothetical protein
VRQTPMSGRVCGGSAPRTAGSQSGREARERSCALSIDRLPCDAISNLAYAALSEQMATAAAPAVSADRTHMFPCDAGLAWSADELVSVVDDLDAREVATRLLVLEYGRDANGRMHSGYRPDLRRTAALAPATVGEWA